jgi:tetratricopeptide (TPR) repeat protein
MKRLILAILCLATALPVQATDNLTKGIAFYNGGRYDQALPYLQDTVSKNPRKWQGHYYLANTYYTLGRTPEAVEQYQLTQAWKPTPDVAAACQTVLGRIAATSIRHTGMPDHSREFHAHDDYVNIKKQELLRDATADSLRNRQDVDNRLMNTSNTAGGNASIGNKYAPMIEQQRARVMQQEAALKEQVLIEDARTKMRKMH